MDKQNVVYLYNGIPFSNKIEWAIDMKCNMDESQGEEARQKGVHIWFYSIYINSRKWKHPEWQSGSFVAWT